MRKILHHIVVSFNILLAVSLLLAYLAPFISPSVFWPVAFFGLAFPYILILNLIFVVYWLFRWKRAIFISLISILAGIYHINNYIPIFQKSANLTGEQTTGQDLKVLSYNVRAFNLYDWLNDPNTNKGIFNFIRSEHPDIICLQEFYTGRNSEFSPERISNLFRETPYQHVHYSYQTGKNTGYGIATFSRFPIKEKGKIQFENSGNLAIFTDIDINGNLIRVYNNHLQSIKLKSNNYAFIDSLKLKYNEQQMREIQEISGKIKKAFITRSKQAERVSEHISTSPFPVIVCGDFNDTPVSYTYRKMRRDLNDAFVTAGKGLGTTYLGWPPFRIDYIFYSKEFTAMEFEKVEAKLSDHYPILVRLKL